MIYPEIMISSKDENRSSTNILWIVNADWDAGKTWALFKVVKIEKEPGIKIS